MTMIVIKAQRSLPALSPAGRGRKINDLAISSAKSLIFQAMGNRVTCCARSLGWDKLKQRPPHPNPLPKGRGLSALAGAVLFAGFALSAPIAHADSDPAATPPQLDKLQRADGARVVPERFLRSWDPVTVFFDKDAGPAGGGPEDHPEKLVTVKPAVPGAWQWLGPRALQFRPADPWKPLQAVEFTADGHTTRLAALLPAPVSSSPSDQSDGVAELSEVALTFAGPVDADALARLISIELRPSPGVDAAGGQPLGPQDFSIKTLERTKRDEKQTYAVKLRSAVPDGRVLVLRLKLADEPGFDEPVYELKLKSAVPFRVTDLTCGNGFERNTADDVLRCAPYSSGSSDEGESETARASLKRRMNVAFSAKPEALDVMRAREALRITPPVDDLAVEPDGSRIKLSGRFLADTVYQLRIEPGSVMDQRKRPLEGAAFTQRFAFAPEKPSIKWDAAQGVVERFGPQFAPVRGRGFEKADVRIHAIDPLSRDFWPFPEKGLATDDEDSPPLPGNEPEKWSASADVQEAAIAARIKALGSPAVSELMSLPIQRGGVEAKFGLDLKPRFAKIAGADQPGTYLVGLRPTTGGKRQWMRAQVTDLTLSAVEEAARVHFAVTSLSTAKPVEGARVRLEGLREDTFIPLADGVTSADGTFTWVVDRPGAAAADLKKNEATVKRVIISKGADTLVIEPDRAPSQYMRENWSKPDAAWLAWTFDSKRDRAEKARTLCHVFTERPIYRPEEAVHIKGYVRKYLGGKLNFSSGGGTVVVSGPANQEWRIPVKLDARGGFYHKFDAATPATGDYSVHYEPEGATGEKKTEAAPMTPTPAAPEQQAEPEGDQQAADAPETDAASAEGEAEATPAASADAEGEGEAAAPEEEIVDNKTCGTFPFKKEAYRLPTFEVLLNGAQQVPLDAEFNVDLLARYFAGGLVSERPIKWRAVQFPHAWTPPGREGFMFSTDARFSGGAGFKSSPVLERDGRTDAGGASRITFDTAIEPTAQPRRYQIEATVTGDDDIQVRAVQSIVAVPPFVLGVKAPRYVAKPGVIEPELLAVNGKGDPVEGLEMTVRFVRRNWTSVLQASDFSQGAAKYVTQVIDETLIERKATSLKEALKQSFEARESGVYLVQVEATDRIGRRQQVSVDMFVGGDTPVTWAKPPAQTATITTDKDEYAPGETATLVIQSPFQTARALAIVEEPEGQFKYDWVDIANGFGRYPVTVRKEQMPKAAVHFLIMRGRLAETAPNPTAAFDQGKPVTIAATKWITVTPVKNIVTAKLEYPAKARPGQEVEVTLRLADDQGKPLSGEATFWMVDQAVLSLAKEQPLDPLPNFIVNRPTKMTARDTRNMAFGVIPLEETPGGDGGREEWGADNNISVRKNFTPVPIYLPSVQVGEDGVAHIKVPLPDTLTVFKLRAKAVSGTDRFGYAVGEMLIRQELVAQPALPRFVRPGDQFDAGLIGRVVEGPGGTGRATASFQGLTLSGAGEQNFAWEANKPVRLQFPVNVAEPTPGKEKVKLRFGLSRDFDKASDTVEIELPVRPDRPPVREYEIFDLAAGQSRMLPGPKQSVRSGSYERQLVVAADPALVRLVGGLQYLIEYPYGCTEQRMSLASAALAVKPFAPLLAAAGLEGRVSGDVKNAVRAIEQSLDADGLAAFWPKSPGNVSLTAWSYVFLIEAQKAGEPVDKALIERLGAVLKQALRSDYARLIGGSEIRERVEALTALAAGGKLEQSYVAELARRANVMPNLTVAEMTAAVAGLPGEDKRILGGLAETMWSRVQILSRDGRQVYAGLAGESDNPIILPSETRSLAEMTRAAALATPSDPRLAVLRDGLMRLGAGDGWGSTNANAAAVRALAAVWRKPAADLPVALTSSAGAQTLTLNGATPVRRRGYAQAGDVNAANQGLATVVVLADTRYQPTEPGSKAQPQAQGFVVSRQSFRAPAGGGALEKLTADADGVVNLKVGDVIEEAIEVVTSEDRTHVAITAPLAAGLEPLNPNLANAPAEAAPSSGPTLTPTWVSYGDDRVFYAYDSLPRGNYRFVFRTKALIPGGFTQPPAEVETMYQKGVYGASAGAKIVIAR
jgi:alpha-2-macroglobulin